MASDVVVQLGDAATAEELFEPICELYDEVFSQPPFVWTDTGSEHHREGLLSLKDEPSFGISIATVGGQLIGFAYGFTLPSTTKRWQQFEAPLPRNFVTEERGQTFSLIDYAVKDEWRGHGIGRRLLDTLFASRPEERVTLTVQPTAAETQAIYKHWGWQYLGRKVALPGAVSPFWDVYVLPLHAKP